MGIVIALVLGFVAFEAAGYLIHRLMHCRWTGSFYKAHLTHHGLYPPSDFVSSPYRHAGADSAVPRFTAICSVVAVILFVVFPWYIAFALTIEMGLVALFNDYMHGAVHINGHWLEKYTIYRRWRAAHMIHHRNVRRNYGFTMFFIDRVVGTYTKH